MTVRQIWQNDAYGVSHVLNYLFNRFANEFFMNTIITMDVPITLERFFFILESVEQAQAGVYFEVNALLSEVRTHCS